MTAYGVRLTAYHVRFTLLLLGVLLAAGCGTVLPTQQPMRFTLVASSSAQPLALDLARAMHRDYPDITVYVLPVANEAAAQQTLLSGQAGAALVAGDDAAAPELTARPIANDALAVVVHPERALASISLDQMNELLRGNLRAWPELNAGDGDIQIFAREPGSAARQVMNNVFLGPRPLTPTALLLPTDEQLRARVAADPNAIGLLPAAWLDDSVQGMPLEGREPYWVRNRWPDYPAVLAIWLLTPAQPAPAVQAFDEYLQSPAGSQVINRGYAALEVQP